MNTQIHTYGEARQAAFRRLVLTRRIAALQELAKAGQAVREDLQRHQTALERGGDLVAAIAPRMLSWAA